MKHSAAWCWCGLVGVWYCCQASCLFANEVYLDKGKLWSVEVALGYSQATGNTETNQVDGRALANRKTPDNELTVKADSAYSSEKGEMTGQKYYTLARYAYSFGMDKHWYHFFKQEADRDHFANIAYRLIPSTGVGYWFADQPDWKLLAEAGLGIEHTRHRHTVDDTTEPVAVPRAYVEKKLFGKLKVSEDLVTYPSLSDVGEYRVRSEGIVEYPLSPRWAVRLSLIDEYNSDAAPDLRNNDLRMTSSLVYSY